MRFLALAALLVACGGSTPQTAEVAQPLPSASSQRSEALVVAQTSGDPRPCDRLGPRVASPRQKWGPPASVGQMTEEFARAKRLFDAERWADAAPMLDRIAKGASGDDEGNRELAAYKYAIALYRLGDHRGSYAAFAAIAHRGEHVKHPETLLWLVKFVKDEPSYVDFADFGTYERDDVARFNNSEQREIFSAASFAVGRERLQEGERAEAAAFFGNVGPEGPLAPLAARCRELAK